MFNIFKKSSEPISLWFSTDTHCHVVPGVDDGSPDADTSSELVAAMYDMGIRHIIATPHVTQATFENNPQTLAGPIQALKDALTRDGVNVRLDHSAEYRIDELLQRHIEQGILMPFPDNYLLIENSFIQEPWNIEQLVFDLQVRGYKPILAHPERYLYYHARGNRYKELHRNLLFQVNMLSLAGYYGKQEKKMAESLAKAGMVDFLGTDMHGHRHVTCLREYLASSEARYHRDLLAKTIKNNIFD